LGVQERSDIPLVELIAGAAHDRHLLLVVDNFEHLLEAAPVVPSLLGACPAMTMLVTSRTHLRVAGEWAYEIGPLVLPQASEQTLTDDVATAAPVQLFVQRASAADFRFSPDEKTLRSIVEICRRLGGLPLAIELAAARVKVLPPNAMLDQLQRSLGVLQGGGPDIPERHRTMENAIRWSYELLSPAEQAMFRALRVFAGSFTVEAAVTVVAGASEFERGETDSAIESLVAQSLLRIVESNGNSQPRFSMLEPLRDFAREISAAREEDEILHEAHAGYFLELAERGRPYFGPDRVARVDEVERDASNISLALGWLIDRERTHEALRLANALVFTLWTPRGRIHEQLIWLSRVLALPGDGLERERAAACAGVSVGEARLGRLEAALAAAGKAREYARSAADRESMAWSMVARAIPLWRTGELESAGTELEGALSIALQLDHRFLIGWTYHNLAVCAALSGDQTQATSLFDAALETLQALGDPWELADLESNFAWFVDTMGESTRSVQLERHALKEYWRLGEQWLLQFSLWTAASRANEIGRHAQAARLFGAMEQLGRQTGAAVPFGYLREHDEEVGRVRSHMGKDDFETAWLAGKAMDLDTAVAEADDAFSAWEAASTIARISIPDRHGLSRREIDVLRLVAAGKSNRTIGEALFISEATVKVHIRSIMRKLDLGSRTALASFAIRQHLD
ncbi:MAG: hypothetical protein IT335_11290, partial [Thermomicrobiales bacterium]|nr:hypothetical protein [Thermomicrobiales bacterium]